MNTTYLVFGSHSHPSLRGPHVLHVTTFDSPQNSVCLDLSRSRCSIHSWLFTLPPETQATHQEAAVSSSRSPSDAVIDRPRPRSEGANVPPFVAKEALRNSSIDSVRLRDGGMGWRDGGFGSGLERWEATWRLAPVEEGGHGRNKWNKWRSL